MMACTHGPDRYGSAVRMRPVRGAKALRSTLRLLAAGRVESGSTGGVEMEGASSERNTCGR
jgi:hypothetical protein